MCTSDTDLVVVKEGEKKKIKMVIAAEEDVGDSCARKVLRLNLFFLLSRTFGRGVKNGNSTLCVRTMMMASI